MRRTGPGSIPRRSSGGRTAPRVARTSGAPVVVGRIEAMSKSRRNTVDPGAIIARYGADTARWFILSDNPPDRDMEWTEAGVAGAYRFLQRCPGLADQVVGATRCSCLFCCGCAGAAAAHAPDDPRRDLGARGFRVQQRGRPALRACRRDRRCRSGDGAGEARREAIEILVRLAAPMIPHLAEELYARLHPGSPRLVAEMPWPEADPALPRPRR